MGGLYVWGGGEPMGTDEQNPGERVASRGFDAV